METTLTGVLSYAFNFSVSLIAFMIIISGSNNILFFLITSLKKVKLPFLKRDSICLNKNISDYPKMMVVSNYPIKTYKDGIKREVVGYIDGRYLVEEWPDREFVYYGYLYAIDLVEILNKTTNIKTSENE